MAKYNVDHTCGHQEEYQLYGKHTERDRKLAWLATQPCNECRKAATAAATAKAAEAIRASGAVDGLPTLEGSEKQVAWAETIRAATMARLNTGLDEIKARVEAARAAGNPEIETLEDTVMGVYERVQATLRNPSARYWIDEGQGLTVRDLRDRIARDREEGEARKERERREAEAAALKATETNRRNARLRDLAARARELFGSDQAEFTVQVWDRDGDRRVYVGHGYDNNWIAYYHTGTARTAPGSLEVLVQAIVRDLATHLGIAKGEAEALIKDFCAGLCKEWTTLKLEVCEGNAPRDPACSLPSWVVWDGDSRRPWYLRIGGPSAHTSEIAAAARFGSAEEARAAAEAAGKADWKVVSRPTWTPFPPKAAAMAAKGGA